MDNKFSIPVSGLQYLLRPFFVALPVDVAFESSHRVLELWLLRGIVDQQKHDYLSHLFEAYREILSE